MERKPLFGPVAAHKWEAKAIMNPTAIKEGDAIHLIYRAVQYSIQTILVWVTPELKETRLNRDQLKVFYRCDSQIGTVTLNLEQLLRELS